MPRQSLLSLPILLYNNYIVSMTEPSWAYITTYIAIKRWTDLPISKQRNKALPARKLEDDCIHGGGGDSGCRNCGAGYRRGLEEGWRPSAWTLSTDIYKTSRRPVPFSTIWCFYSPQTFAITDTFLMVAFAWFWKKNMLAYGFHRNLS